MIISNYLEAGNEKRLFEDHLDLISDTYDYEITGARLLGRNISNVTSDKVRKSILEILEKDKLILLATEMARYEGLSSERDEKVKKCLELLNSLREGLEDNQ